MIRHSANATQHLSVAGCGHRAFHLSSQVGESYRLDVFAADRFKCDSILFLQTSGVQFVRQWEDTLPLDYLSEISENTHVGSVIQVRLCVIVVLYTLQTIRTTEEIKTVEEI